MSTPTLANWKESQETGFSEDTVPAELWAAHLSVEELRQTFRSRLKERWRNSNLPKVLYHYTDVRGLQGMLSSYMMWLSDAAFMNDPLEGSWSLQRTSERCLSALGESLLADEVKRRIDSTLGAPDLWDASVRADVTDEYLRFAVLNEAFRPAFIASFTEDEDLLSQWRGYGNGGAGVSIGFDLQEIEHCKVKYGGDEITPKLIKVNYCSDDLDNELDSIFDAASHVFSAHIHQLEGNLDAASHLKLATAEVIEEAVCALRWEFKSPHYREEREWRLVANGFGPNLGGKSRVSKGTIVRYLEMPLPQRSDRPLPRLLIEKIVLGPTCPPTLLRALRVQLTNLAFPTIERSQLALR